jgi:phenylalanine-4-hydroxylase
MDQNEGHNPLGERPFSYFISKDQKVFITWLGKQVTILKGKKAQQFINNISNLDIDQTQLVMAKVTGNFKRGNEKQK